MDRRLKKGDEYRCGCCGGTFAAERDDDEALTECEIREGELPPDELEVVCDDCFRKVMGLPQPPKPGGNGNG